ncbi:hypothetical protein WMF00_22485 [Sorangium sp. So ce1182]
MFISASPDLEQSKRFYRAVLQALGRDPVQEGPGYFTADELFVSPSDGGPVSRVHLAIQTADREQVHRFHEEALAAGGRDNGVPGDGITTRGITGPSCSIQTGTTSRPSTTGRRSGRRRRW